MATAEKNLKQIEEHSKLLKEIVTLLSQLTDNISDNRSMIAKNAELTKRVCETLDTLTKEIY